MGGQQRDLVAVSIPGHGTRTHRSGKSVFQLLVQRLQSADADRAVTGRRTGSWRSFDREPRRTGAAGPSSQGGGPSWQKTGNDLQQAWGVSEGYPSATYSDGEGASVALPLGAVAFGIDFLVNFFEDLFSGPNSPPIPRKLMHKRHPLYGDILGIDSGTIPTEGSQGVTFCADPQPCNKPPLQKSTPAPPSACSQYDAECAQSKSSDTYACKAGDCCRSFGDTTFADCTRGCLLSQERVCFGSSGAAGCRAWAHAKCYASCAQSLGDLTQWLNFPACRSLAPELVP